MLVRHNGRERLRSRLGRDSKRRLDFHEDRRIIHECRSRRQQPRAGIPGMLARHIAPAIKPAGPRRTVAHEPGLVKTCKGQRSRRQRQTPIPGASILRGDRPPDRRAPARNPSPIRAHASLGSESARRDTGCRLDAKFGSSSRESPIVGSPVTPIRPVSRRRCADHPSMSSDSILAYETQARYAPGEAWVTIDVGRCRRVAFEEAYFRRDPWGRTPLEVRVVSVGGRSTC